MLLTMTTVRLKVKKCHPVSKFGNLATCKMKPCDVHKDYDNDIMMIVAAAVTRLPPLKKLKVLTMTMKMIISQQYTVLYQEGEAT